MRKLEGYSVWKKKITPAALQMGRLGKTRPEGHGVKTRADNSLDQGGMQISNQVREIQEVKVANVCLGFQLFLIPKAGL